MIIPESYSLANASTSSATANKGLYATVENVVVGEDGTLTLTIQGDGSKGYGLTALITFP